MVIAYGLDDRKPETVARRFFRRTTEAVEYLIFIQRRIIGGIGYRQSVIRQGYGYFPSGFIVAYSIHDEVVYHAFQQGTVRLYRQRGC